MLLPVTQPGPTPLTLDLDGVCRTRSAGDWAAGAPQEATGVQRQKLQIKHLHTGPPPPPQGTVHSCTCPIAAEMGRSRRPQLILGPLQRKLASLVLAALGFKPGLQALRKPLCLAKNPCWVSSRLHGLGLLVKVNNGPWLDWVPSSTRQQQLHLADTLLAHLHVLHLGTNSRKTPELLGRIYRTFLRDLCGLQVEDRCRVSRK